jgi:predicted membrane chloride channel (bestrophin family)
MLAIPSHIGRWYLIVLQWITARIGVAHRSGVLTGGPGFEQLALQKCCDLRAACMTVPDELAARMPLAYVHFTHCLVDILLLIAPFALYANLGFFAIPMTGLFTLFYRGLLELSKSFLDPFGNRRVSYSGLSSDISIDCLIGESNAGSLIWPQGALKLPFN